MTWKRSLLALLALACASPITAQDDIMPLTEPVALDPSDPDRVEFGELLYRGGVMIEPGDAKIGGISGLEWHDETLYAVSDDGRWLTITPDEINGQLADIFSIFAGPLRDPRGRRLRKKEMADAEAITRSPDGNWLVSFERDHRIWRYAELEGAAAPFELPIASLVSEDDPNAGIEALDLALGDILFCGEFARPGQANCTHTFAEASEDIALDPGIAGVNPVPTGAACDGRGTCYILLRAFTAGVGNHIAIMQHTIGQQAVVLAQFGPDLAIDNFEGIALREAFGRTFLYIVSDNNFSNRQRTLLMKFEIAGEDPETPPAPPPGSVTTTEVTEQFETVAVVLETTMGAITIALETERAPITAANFLRYVDEDRLDGTVFYRAMRLDREPLPNGLIQGGTQWDPDRILPGITHEPTTLTGLSHTSGALSMAMGEPGSANGDFSIMIQDQTGLDAQPDSEDPVWKNGYAVFGYVTEGMEVVEMIHAAPVDPDKGEGWMQGQMLAEPVVIIDARRAANAAP